MKYLKLVCLLKWFSVYQVCFKGRQQSQSLKGPNHGIKIFNMLKVLACWPRISGSKFNFSFISASKSWKAEIARTICRWESVNGSTLSASKSVNGSRLRTSKTVNGSRLRTSKTVNGSRLWTSKIVNGSRLWTSKTVNGSTLRSWKYSYVARIEVLDSPFKTNRTFILCLNSFRYLRSMSSESDESDHTCFESESDEEGLYKTVQQGPEFDPYRSDTDIFHICGPCLEYTPLIVLIVFYYLLEMILKVKGQFQLSLTMKVKMMMRYLWIIGFIFCICAIQVPSSETGHVCLCELCHAVLDDELICCHFAALCCI